MVGRINELAEEAKVAVRNIRRDGNKAAETGEKDKEFSEDDRDQAKEEIQELTDLPIPGHRFGKNPRTKRSWKISPLAFSPAYVKPRPVVAVVAIPTRI